MMTGSQALKLAEGYIDYDRSKFRAEYKRMTGIDFGATADWCCGFASCIVVGWGGAKLEGLPSLWCPTARTEATKAGREVSLSSAKPGDVVYFEWSGNDNADHVGIFKSYVNGVLTTIDGNVSNRVGERSRTKKDWKKVWIVRPEYKKESSDGGVEFLVKALQQYLQYKGYYQGYLIDGKFEYFTQKALQQYLADLGFYNREIDGDFAGKSQQSFLAALKQKRF